jgi:hypothetical protein
MLVEKKRESNFELMTRSKKDQRIHKLIFPAPCPEKLYHYYTNQTYLVCIE